MTDFSDLLTATRAVTDPSTSAAELTVIAQTQPSLQAQVAAHPNAHPELLDWLASDGDDVAKQAVSARRTALPNAQQELVAQTGPARGETLAEPQVPNSPTPDQMVQAPVSTGTPAHSESVSASPLAAPRIPWFRTSRGLKALIGGAAGVVVVVVAIVLVVTLVVIPNQRAGQAAESAAAASASASVQMAQDHQDAVNAFNSAAQACTSANSQLASVISSAQQAAQTDPSTMQDPTLIDKLNQVITTAQAVKTCMAPTIADDTATIQQQTAQLGTDTQTVTSATSTLTSASQAVPASVQAKQQAAAQASASASAAAHTKNVTITDSDGYKWQVTLTFSDWVKGSDSQKLQQTWQSMGGSGQMPLTAGSYSSQMGSAQFVGTNAAYVFGKATYQYMTTQWSASDTPPIVIDPMTSSTDLLGNQSGLQAFDLVTGKNVVQCTGYNNGANCTLGGWAGTGVNSNTISPDMAGQTTWGPVAFVIAVDDVFTPAEPDGIAAYQSVQLGIATGISRQNSLGVTLAGDTTPFTVGRTW